MAFRGTKNRLVPGRDWPKFGRRLSFRARDSIVPDWGEIIRNRKRSFKCFGVIGP